MHLKNRLPIFLFLFTLMFILVSCNQSGEHSTSPGKLKIVATTTIVGDVVRNVAADAIDLRILLPLGADPHSYEPTPKDVALISDADIVFANGAGLEEFLEPLIISAGADDKIVYLSDTIDLIHPTDNGNDGQSESTQDQNEGKSDHFQPHADPHVWTNPNNVIAWVHTIESVLNEADPGNADTYGKNAISYIEELTILDNWIRNQVAFIPEENRRIVTDHLVFAYFAQEYGFIQVGAIIPGYSTMSEASAQDLASLENAIEEMSINAIFVGNTVNPALAERIAEDTGTKLVFVYTGSLSEPGGPADTYIKYMQFLTNAFVDNLR